MSHSAYRAALSAAESPRQTEYRLFADVTAALSEAKRRNARGPELVEALDWNRRLWSTLSSDCAAAENGLPPQIRAKVISIELWVSRYASDVALGRADIDALIDINRIIMEGLASQPAATPPG